MKFVVEMLNIRKEFPGVVANDDISLQLNRRITLLGENGAGSLPYEYPFRTVYAG